MKKTFGILSSFLALTIAVNAVTPAMSVTIQNAFSPESQIASVLKSLENPSETADEEASQTALPEKETAFADGKILIYNYAQLSKIGSGTSFTYEDGVTATYTLDAEYQIARDIPLPRHTLWQLPDGFTGKISGEKQKNAPLYSAQSDAIYLYNPYQLAVMAMDNRDEQPVMSGDADAAAFGTGKVVCTDEANKNILTYGDDRNYVVSAQFCSEVTEKPISVISKKSVEPVGAKSDASAGAKAGDAVGATSDGRDFDGQVIKTINGEAYILIGNEDQLRAIGTDAEVFTPIYQVHHNGTHYYVDTDNGQPIQLYGGDADLAQEHNGYRNYNFHQINDKTRHEWTIHYFAGVDQETGNVNLDHVALETTDLIGTSWKTNKYYTTTENYIIFRDIDLGGQSDPWTPLMFSGKMYGAESANGEKLWNGNGITDSTAITATAEANRPKIKNVYVRQDTAVNVNNYIGVGFFATISNQPSANDIGLSGGTAIVKNIDLNGVHVENNTTQQIKNVNTSLINEVTSGLGSALTTVLGYLLELLSVGSIPHDTLDGTLENLLNARPDDPTALATGAFAGRIYGDVLVEDCRVSGTVSVSSVNDRVGGFVGYTEGMTQYDGLSQALSGVSALLAGVLNVIPAIGLGDLITILLDNGLEVGKLIPTGYIEPKIVGCEVNGLTGVIGHINAETNAADKEFIGGFVGEQIGTRIENSTVTNSSFAVKAKKYGGGFCGLARDAVIMGTLDGLGVDLTPAILENLNTTLSQTHPQSVLIDCVVSDWEPAENETYNVTGEDMLGGFVGAMANSYAVDCSVDCQDDPIKINAAGSDAGGFAGYASVGWQSSLGDANENSSSLLGTVGTLVTSLLSSNPSEGQMLLSLMGVSPSAIIGCSVYSSGLEVTAGDSFAGGLLGRGDAVYIGTSDQAAYDVLAEWNSGTLKEAGDQDDKPVIIGGLKSVTAQQNCAGGVAGYIDSAQFQGLLNNVAGLGDFIGFSVRDIEVTGIDGGYTVTAGNYNAGGGFGLTVGGTIDNVNLNELKRVQAKNRAAGFVGVAGPGELLGTGGLTINLLGLDRLLSANNLLNIGQGVQVTISDCNVTGIADGFEVEATGVNPSGAQTVYEFTAAGFIADSNSTDISNAHVDKLKSVTATDSNGFAGGFIGSSETGGLAEAANNDANGLSNFITEEDGTSVLEINKLVDAIGYLIPSYTNCTTTFVDGGLVNADIAGGFVADLESGTVDNSTIASVDDQQNPKWTKTMKELNDPDVVNRTGDLDKQFAVFNIDAVHGRTYGGGFGGKLRSGALANAGGGLSILGTSGLSINLNDLAKVMNTYVPFVNNAGVYSESGFTVTANTIRAGDSLSGSAGGFAGYMSGAQVSHCDVYQLKNTKVNPPSDLEAASAPSYYNNSTYAVTGGHFAGGYVGNADIGSAASVGHSLGVLGSALDLNNIASALSVVVTTIEHSDVQGAAGGFSAIADGTDSTGKVGRSGGYAGEISGAHIQNSHCKNFYYIIGQETAGGYVGDMKPGDVAKLLDNASVIGGLVNVDGSLLSLVEDFIPTIRNSTTSCVPCGGGVRADAASDGGHQRGCAGGYCGLNEGGHIWGLNTNTWQRQNDGTVGSRNFGHDTEGNYTGEQHIATAWRIRSVYGAEYAGGFTGYMVAADTASTGNISLLSGLVKTSNLLNALSVVYPTEKNTAVYGPLRNLDAQTWTAWAQYVGKYGGYGLDIVKNGLSSPQSQYYYGCHVVAGRTTATDSGTYPITEGGDAGGYVGLMHSGVISNGQSYDMKLVRAMRNAGGYAGSMQTGGLADVGEAEVKLFGLDLSADLGTLVRALGEVFVPTVRSGSVRGWESGLTVIATGVGSENDDATYRCGYAGGYVGSAYGAQIWGNKSVGDAAGTGCNVYKLRYVRGTNAVGGFVGLATSASVAAVDTNASQRGLLKNILSSVVKSKENLVSVLNATLTTIYQAQVNPSENNESDSFGFVVEGVGDRLPLYAGGFAGELDATVIGDREGNANEKIIVNDLRSVNAKYYAGGFFGYADVKGVADVSDNDETYLVGGLLDVGEVNVIEAFRPYIYYSEVNGVADGIIVRAHNEGTNSLFSETRKTGCAGGFGGAMMDGTVKNSKVAGLNTVVAPNYTGGFIGHMGKSGVVNANGAQLNQLLGATAGVFDILSTHTDNCDVVGISDGAVITATGGSEPIAGGFVGYADVSKINTCNVQNLKQVYSDEIAGGFVGKTDRHFLVSLEAGSPLVQGVTLVVNTLLAGLLVDDLENINLINLNLGILEVDLLSDGKTAYVDLLGLKIGVSLLTHDDNGNTGTALVTIGDSSVELAYTNGQIDFNNPNSAGVAVNLIKGNRTRIENSSVTGISDGYDVYGGGSSNTADGSGANGMAGGFAGYNKEGRLLNNSMEYCDAVRGAAELVGPFSGHTELNSVYSFNTLQSIEGENNVYSVYRNTNSTYALTSGNQTISNNPTTDNGYQRFDITHLAAPITPEENEAYQKIYGKWNGAKLASSAAGADASLIKVYVSNKKAVLMSDTPTSANDESLVPNPGDKKDPCEETIKLTVQKVWDDQNNKNGTRPDEIKVRLRQQAYDEYGAEQGNPQVYTDATVISDIDTTDGWFVITEADHARADSATWTRVINGLPAVVEQSGAYTYYTYSVEEAPVIGYSSAVTHQETESTAIAKIVNTPEPFVIEFKYYDRYHDNNTFAGIQNTPTTYSMTLDGIPDKFIDCDEDGKAQSVDYAGLIGEKAVEFSNNALAVNNVMCDYDLWTSQSAAVQALSRSRYFYFNNGEHVSYGNGQIYHTDYLGKPQISDETKWVSYYDFENNEISEADATGDEYAQVRKITVWCYNYPKQYDVDIYGATGFSDVTPKAVDGNTVYVSSSAASQSQLSGANGAKFYYNQRFGDATDDVDQNNMSGMDNAGFIANYGLPGYTGVKPSDYAVESFENNGTVYNFAYWAYDQEGTQIASVERNFWYRVTTKTKLYAVYAQEGSNPGISISADTNDTYVDSSGTSRTRLNILGSVFGAPAYDTNVQKLSFVNISLSTQIRDNPAVYTPEKINALFEQYKDQLKDIIKKYDDDNGSKSFSSAETYNGDIDPETRNVLEDLQLTLTTKGFIYTVTSNGNTPATGDSTILLTNKNRAHFTANYKTSALNINGTGSNGDTCIMFCGALKYNDEWSVSTNCLIYFNGKVVANTDSKWQ